MTPESARLVAVVAVMNVVLARTATAVDGTWVPAATALTVALCGALVVVEATDRPVRPDAAAMPAASRWAGAAVAGQLVVLAVIVSEGNTTSGAVTGGVVVLGVVLVGLVVDGAQDRPRVPGAWPWLVLVVGGGLLALGASSWSVVNDVTVFQRRAVEVLLAGGDPYASRIFPDVFTPAESARFYHPDVTDGETLLFGFPYMPFGLLLAVPAVALGEVALLHLAALLAGAWAIHGLGRGRLSGRVAMVLLLSSPVSVVLLLGAWNDGLVGTLLLLLALAWQRDRRLTADALLGLLLATKQYTVLVVPLYLVLAARRRGEPLLRPLIPAGVTAAIITLPFLVANPGGFVSSTVTLQFLQPFRPDSTSLLFLLSDSPPTWTASFAFVAALVATFFALRVVPSSAGGLLRASAIVLLAFFVLSKQSFANYYQLVMMVLCGLLATLGDWQPEESVGTVRRRRSRGVSGS